MIKKLTHDDYSVAWICEAGDDFDTAVAMLDTLHESAEQLASDHSVYRLGDIAGHNLVVAGLTEDSKVRAKSTIFEMKTIFPNLSAGLFVGTAGGVPRKTDQGDIRLGDLVVSKPTATQPGVVEYCQGIYGYDEVQEIRAFLSPPDHFLRAVQRVNAKWNTPDGLTMQDGPLLNSDRFPGRDQDLLFDSDSVHRQPGLSCSECSCQFESLGNRIPRIPEARVAVHCGTIATGDASIANALTRDHLAQTTGAYCIESGAIGLLAELPCLVIRGIASYCDSHKNGKWETYAAGVAATYAREILVNLSVNELMFHYSPTSGDRSTLREVSAWLSPTNYGARQRHLKSTTAQISRSNFLNRPQYVNWLQSAQKTLHLSGLPGSGRTMVTSSVIHNLQARFSGNPQVAVAFIFCGYQKESEQTATQILFSILKQLLLSQGHVPRYVEDLYDAHWLGQTLPGYSDIFRVLSAVANETSRTFIVIDGLSETNIPEVDQHRLLRSLMTLQHSANANILITSDTHHSLAPITEDATSVLVRPSETDIHSYFDVHSSRLPSFIRDDAQLRQRIEILTEGFNGQFLIAPLYSNILSKAATVEDVQDLLTMDIVRPKVYDEAYHDLFRLIERQNAEEVEVAKTLLLWLTFTNKRLSMSGIRHLLRLHSSLQHAVIQQVTPAYVVSACAGLVTINHQTGVADFMHPTTREYFSCRRSEIFPDGEGNLTTVCLKCLTDVTARHDARAHSKGKPTAIDRYAIRNWGYHASRSTSEHTGEVVSLLENGKVLERSGLAIISSNDYPEYINAKQSKFTGLHLASFFGLERAIEVLLQKQEGTGKSFFQRFSDIIFWRESIVDAQETFGRTPLSFAAEKGHVRIVCTLLAGGASIESRDSNGRTPLMFAAKGGHVDTVEELLKAGALIDMQDRAGRSALSWAAANGHDDLVRLFLQHGARLEIPSWTHSSFFSPIFLLFQTKARRDVMDEPMCGVPLIRAACHGHDSIIQTLILAGASPDQRDRDGRTGLSWAASNGHESTARLLLENHAHLNSLDSTGRTTLSWAAGNGQTAVINCLMTYSEICLEMHDNDGRTAASWAAANGQKHVLRALSDIGADLTTRDRHGMTTLLLACVNGHRSTVEWLLSVPGISLEDQDCNGRTAFSWAVSSGIHYMVEFLLSKGVFFDTVDDRGLTVLSWAAREGHQDMIRLLFKNGGERLLPRSDNTRQTALHWAAANGHAKALHLLISKDRHGLLHSRDISGLTPLSWACKNGHKAVAQAILRRGQASLERRDNLGNTPLMLAVDHYHTGLVQLLLEHGATVEVRDLFGNTPLRKAVESGSSRTAELLLSHGANPNARFDQYRTPLMLAARKSSFSLVTLLLRHGANIHARDSKGRTALSFAVEANNENIVELLRAGGASVCERDTGGVSPISLVKELGERGIRVQNLAMPSDTTSCSSSPSPELSSSEPSSSESFSEYEIASGI